MRKPRRVLFDVAHRGASHDRRAACEFECDRPRHALGLAERPNSEEADLRSTLVTAHSRKPVNGIENLPADVGFATAQRASNVA